MARRFSPEQWPSAEDTLAQPTRRRLFALLSESSAPASTAELAARLEMHPNGVRAHLERLERAGLVTRVRLRQARGRPPDAWRVLRHVDAAAGGPGGPYRDLSRWLARSVQGPSGTASIEQTGIDIGRELADDGAVATAGLQGLTDALAVLGFRPELRSSEPDRATICLGNCPYRDAVRENPGAVCSLHRGLTAGLLDRLDPDAAMTEFVPRDPDTAGCTIELERPAR